MEQEQENENSNDGVVGAVTLIIVVILGVWFFNGFNSIYAFTGYVMNWGWSIASWILISLTASLLQTVLVFALSIGAVFIFFKLKGKG